MAIIETHDITKVYPLEGVDVTALQGVSVSIERGEFTAIMGPSGSGKSTFMNILGCLDTPTSGRYILEGQDVSHLGRDQLAEIRNGKIGFVFQGFNLLPRNTAVDNVELPLLYAGLSARERRRRALAALKSVGLTGREHHHPHQLSGGEQQRVAIARALVNNSSIILADEPTGNLDTKMSHEIMSLFVKLNAETNLTLVIVTHEQDIADYGRRTIRFRDGCVVSDEIHEPKVRGPSDAPGPVSAVPGPNPQPGDGGNR
jgi:putative ABC transport system ATP-binding protein